MPRSLPVIPLVLVLSGCLAMDDLVDAPAACPVIDSGDWTAFVNAMPGPDARPQLIVSGTVSLPSAGYVVELLSGPADRSARPVQTVVLQAIAPDGPAAAVVSPADVRLSMPALAASPGAPSPYTGVRVMCEGTELAFIAPIETAW